MNAHILNFFEITNPDALRMSCRLVDVDGPFDPNLGDGDVAERNLHQLLKRVQIFERIPVAIESGGPQPRLAIPASHQLAQCEYELAPDVATLRPRDETFDLQLQDDTKRVQIFERIPVAIESGGPQPRLAIPASHQLAQCEYELAPDVATLRPRDETFDLQLQDDTSRIGTAFLSWYLRAPLFRNHRLWSTGSTTYFDKCPLNFKRDDREIDVYRGFGFRIGCVDDRLGIWVRVIHRYAETRWLLDAYDEATIHQQLRMRHLLYHYGHNWFPVQLLGVTGKSIEEHTFVPEGGSQAISVYDYTVQAIGGKSAPAWVQSLDKSSAAIAFRYPSNEKRRLGAAALCKLLVQTEDPRVKLVHAQSLMDPHPRFVEHRNIVQEHLQKAFFGEVPIAIRPNAMTIERQSFPIPRQEFGQGRILKVGQNTAAGESLLRDYAKKRLDHLLDAGGGFAVNSHLDEQYILIPSSQERKVAEDFKDRLEKTVCSLIKRPYSLTRIIYDNSDARTLKRQVDAIMLALKQVHVQSGKGLLMLPDNAQSDLHNFLKRKLGTNLQFQCVDARKVRDFYEVHGQNGRAIYSVRSPLTGRYVSYLRYTAMGLLLVNRQWPWVLADGTHYDMYVAVDVLYNTAAFTFFGEGGRQCFIRTVQSEQREKLSRKQVRSVVYDHLATVLKGAQKIPRSIVLRRDGRAFRSEWTGFRDAIEQLKSDGLLPSELVYGAVEVHKSTAEGMRLVAETSSQTLENPVVGSWKILGRKEGIVCTTGAPFTLRGTASPVLLRVAAGDLDLEHLLRDFFEMSQLCWSKPDGFIRLSIDLKLCDEQLRAIASVADDDEAQFGEDFSEGEEFEHQAVGWNN